MFFLIIQLLILSSIISLSAGETLTEFHSNETRLGQPRSFPCPNEADIAPCACIYDSDSSRLTLDCTNITSDQELTNIFTKEFPVKDFYEFKIDSSSVLTSLNFICGGVKFLRFNLYPGPFPSLVEVTDIFYESCSNADLDYVRLYNTELSTLVFPPPPLSDKITYFNMVNSNLVSVPVIRSKSLSTLDFEGSQISQITPGTFDEIPNLRTLWLEKNDIKTLASGAIPLSSNGNKYSLYYNGLETIEAGAFALAGEPPLNALIIILHDNLLKTIDASVFGSLMPYIQTLSIYGNPLDCGCDIAWIILNPEYLAKVTLDGYPTCADGKLLTDLDPTPYEDFC